MGITSPLDGFPAEVIGGLKDCCTMLEMADAYGTLANGGTHVAPTILSKVVFPNGKVVNLGDPPHNRVFSDGEAYAGTQVLKTVITEGTGTAANYGCPGRRQDRHRGEPGQRLVRRLHARSCRPRCGWVTRRATSRWPIRLRRNAGRADLARLHGARLGRLLRRLPAAHRPVRRDGVRRPAFLREGAAAGTRPPGPERTRSTTRRCSPSRRGTDRARRPPGTGGALRPPRAQTGPGQGHHGG